MTAERTAELIALETERCRRIAEQDYHALGELLSDRLIHTHTRGNQDSRTSYLEYLTSTIEILDVRRGELRVQWASESVAVMHGRQTHRVRRRGTTEEGQVEAQVIQVWARESDGCWRLLAFQATALGAAPPHIPGK